MSKITIGNIVFEDWIDNSRNYHPEQGSCKRAITRAYNNSIGGIYIDVFPYKIIVSIFSTSQEMADLEDVLSSIGLLTHYSATQYTVAELRDKVDSILIKIEKLKSFK